MKFESFPNSFTLSNPVGRCTNNQDVDNENTDTTKFRQCVCCDYVMHHFN